LGRAIASEHPELAFASIDVGAQPGDRALDALAAALRSGDRAEQIDVSGGVRRVPRLAPITARSATASHRFRRDAAYLVTGGPGAVGLAVAAWMARLGAGHLVLMGRRDASDAALRAIDAVLRAGARVLVERGDVSIEADAARILARFGA